MNIVKGTTDHVQMNYCNCSYNSHLIISKHNNDNITMINHDNIC